MKKRFWLYKRGEVFYLQDAETRQKESLHTKDAKEAQRLRDARNQSVDQPHLGLALAKAYLAAYDPLMTQRSWETVMVEFSTRGKPTTQNRKNRAFLSQSFNPIRHKKLLETTADDLFKVMNSGGNTVNHFLRCLHNLALGLGWLPNQIIPSKLWPSAHAKPKRGITWDEHQKILASEKMVERQNFYQLLWEIGASQTDTVKLAADNVDWGQRILAYQRQKTGQWAHMRIGARLEVLLQQLPHEGPFFPTLRTTTDSARAAEFYRRCHVAGVEGVSLHSYRYAWAERAKSCGYPERWAQNALGHNSRAVHEAYAKEARAICPSMEEYEQRPGVGKVVSLSVNPAPVPVSPNRLTADEHDQKVASGSCSEVSRVNYPPA